MKPDEKKTFRIKLGGWAWVEQVQDIEAESLEAAIDQAEENYNNHTWHYCEMNEDSVEVMAADEN